MRNLDIVDTRDKLLTYAKVGLLSGDSRLGMPLLSEPTADAKSSERKDGKPGK